MDSSIGEYPSLTPALHPVLYFQPKDLSDTDTKITLLLLRSIGLSIGTRPWIWLLSSLLVSLLCGSGLAMFKEELDDMMLFVPADDPVRQDAKWVKEHFKEDFRFESVIVTAPNVLDPKVLTAVRAFLHFSLPP